MQNSYITQETNRSQDGRVRASYAMETEMGCNLCYPEVYYRIQPLVMSVCDQIDSSDKVMISQEMFYQLSDDIYTKVCSMYPDLAEYANCHDMKSSVDTTQRDRNFDRDRRDRDYDRDRRDRDRDRDRRDRDYYPFFQFRRRGLFRDFIDLLLLNELFRRGRVYF